MASTIQPTGRSKEEIEEILTAAKLDRKDLLPVSQEISFAPNFSSIQYRLVELHKEVAESIKVGSRLVFRGENTENAVLCTDVSTFEIKEAETSNSLLILEELSFPEQAKTGSRSSDSSESSSKSPDSVSNLPVIFMDEVAETEDEQLENEVLVRCILDTEHSYLELKKINPNLSKIRNILADVPFKGAAEDADNDEEKLLTLDKLLELVPASVGEIQGYLKTIRVMDLQGYIRLVDDDYLHRVFSLIIGCIDENSWEHDHIIKSIIVDSIASLEPVFIIDSIFEWFFQPNCDIDDVYSLKEAEVCCFLGEALLKSAGRFNFQDFMKVWQLSVPQGLKVNVKHLERVAVTNMFSSPPSIWHFPEYNLPDVVTDRLSVLFEAKPKWKLDEITPFLQNLPSSQSVGVLLTKFTRVTNVNGVKFYSSKL